MATVWESLLDATVQLPMLPAAPPLSVAVRTALPAAWSSLQAALTVKAVFKAALVVDGTGAPLGAAEASRESGAAI
jgi:hypothetical protein